MKRKIYFILLAALIVFFKGRSQSFITIDGSQVFSTFKFTGSDGKTDNSYASIASGGYSLGYRGYQKAAKPGKRFGALFLRFNAGMRKGGATLIYNNSTINWSLQYCDLRLGFGYELDKWRIKPYVSVAPYYSFLLKGYQTMDGLNYDIKKNKAIKASDAGLLAVPGIKARLSDYISLYSEFSYLIGLQNLETAGKQKWTNRGYFITLGLAAALTKSKPKWTQGRR